MASRITALQRRVMAVLARYGPKSRNAVAYHANTTRTQAQRALNLLNDRGLVERHRVHADHWRLTDAGRQFLESAHG